MKILKKNQYLIQTTSLKTNYTYKVFLLILPMIFFGCSNVFSQNQSSGMAPIIPVKGFIISKSGDTLHGKIKYKKMTENFMSVIRFTGSNGKNTIYDAGSVKGMGLKINPINDSDEYTVVLKPFWDIYECKPSPKKQVKVFMNRFINGRIKIFQDRSSMVYGGNTTTTTTSKFNGIYFEFSPREGLYIGPTYIASYGTIASRSWASSYYYEKDNGKITKITKKNFNALWSELFDDCNKIKEEVKNNPDLKKYKNFILIVNLYNQLCS